MKIHFNTLTSSDVYMAATKANVGIERWHEKGSKSHKGAYDIILSGSSGHRVNSNSIYAQAASWDQWGIFLAELLFKDSSVKAGDYVNRDHFNWSTGHRYTETFTEHKNHKWSYEGDVITGAYTIHRCEKCSAIRRYATKQYVKENFLDSVNA